jgi:hypothetical protein
MYIYIYIHICVILSAYLHRNLEVCIRPGALNLNDFLEWKLIKLLLLLLLLLLLSLLFLLLLFASFKNKRATI